MYTVLLLRQLPNTPSDGLLCLLFGPSQNSREDGQPVCLRPRHCDRRSNTSDFLVVRVFWPGPDTGFEFFGNDIDEACVFEHLGNSRRVIHALAGLFRGLFEGESVGFDSAAFICVVFGVSVDDICFLEFDESSRLKITEEDY